MSENYSSSQTNVDKKAAYVGKKVKKNLDRELTYIYVVNIVGIFACHFRSIKTFLA